MTLTKINIKDFGWRTLMTFMMICPLYYNGLQIHGFKTMRMGHEQAFELGITVLFAIVFVENIWLAMFLVWSCFLYAYYNFPIIGGNYVTHIFLACILYQITYHLVNRKRVETVFKLVLILCGLNIAFCFLQKFGYDPLFMNVVEKSMNIDPVGIMGIKAVSGVFSAISIPIALFFSPFLVIPIIPALIISDCSSAVAATVVSILFLTWHQSRKFFAYMLIPLSLAGCLYFAHDSKMNMMTDRVNVWKIALQDSLARPFVGMGLDSFRNVGALKPFLYFKNVADNKAVRMGYDKENKAWIPEGGKELAKYTDGQLHLDPWDNPHNLYVSIIYEFSIIGFLLFLGLLGDIWRRLYRDPVVLTIFAIFIVYLVSSIGQFPFYLARTAHLAVIFLACYYKLTEKGEDKCLLSR